MRVSLFGVVWTEGWGILCIIRKRCLRQNKTRFCIVDAGGRLLTAYVPPRAVLLRLILRRSDAVLYIKIRLELILKQKYETKYEYS